MKGLAVLYLRFLKVGVEILESSLRSFCMEIAEAGFKEVEESYSPCSMSIPIARMFIR